MNSSSPFHNSPAVEIIEITDPASANAGVELLDQDVVQLQSSSFKARQVIVRLEGAIVVYYATNLRLRTRPTLHKHLMAYVSSGPDATGAVNGLPIRHDTMYIVPPGAGLGIVSGIGYESVTYLLPAGEIETHLKARGRGDEYHMPKESEALRVGTEHSGALFAWGKRLVDAAMHDPEIFNQSSDRRSAAHTDLIETLLTTLSGTRKMEPERQQRTRQSQSELVRLAEQYVLQHIADRVYVTDLCKAVGVSERALEYAFRSVMGMSPVTYLARVRLHRVHEKLLAATPGSTTVTNEALDWGFWHFGEFSRAYKQCFDELPSDTLRRSPTQGPHSPVKIGVTQR